MQLHKMDLVPEDHRDKVFEKQSQQIRTIAGALETMCFATSIWDETLYRAWSRIVYSLIPNVAALERQLAMLCDLCSADEVSASK